jgi:hypothetical protein
MFGNRKVSIPMITVISRAIVVSGGCEPSDMTVVVLAERPLDDLHEEE